MSSAFQVYGLLIIISRIFAILLIKKLSANWRKKRAKYLLMEKAVVTLLICSFRDGQATIAHYLYALSYYIITVTGGGCFERTEISFISFRSSLEIANTPDFHCPHPKTHRHPNFSIHKPLSALMHFHSQEPYFSNRHCSITSSPSSVMAFWGQRLIQR